MEVLGLHQRMARGYVENIMGKPLPHGAVVHFIDDDWSRILRDNLKVFRTQAAHLREHGVAEEA